MRLRLYTLPSEATEDNPFLEHALPTRATTPVLPSSTPPLHAASPNHPPGR
jgi:hypothetical protein